MKFVNKISTKKRKEKEETGKNRDKAVHKKWTRNRRRKSATEEKKNEVTLECEKSKRKKQKKKRKPENSKELSLFPSVAQATS